MPKRRQSKGWRKQTPKTPSRDHTATWIFDNTITATLDPDTCAACVHNPVEDTEWIHCDQCKRWFHQQCLRVSKEAAAAETFYCTRCYLAYERTQQDMDHDMTREETSQADLLLALAGSTDSPEAA